MNNLGIQLTLIRIFSIFLTFFGKNIDYFIYSRVLTSRDYIVEFLVPQCQNIVVYLKLKINKK